MPKQSHERADVLVQRQAGVSRSKAQGLIQTGFVTLPNGERIEKPGMRFPVETHFAIAAEPRFVSRGGEKLEAAFEAFSLDVDGLVALDAGASTGGFTDCLLQHGAAKVYAVDVGYGQLAWRLRQDPRVVVMERFNVRNLEPSDIEAPPSFFTADCSFISLRPVLEGIARVLEPAGRGVALVKPQFEAGREKVGKGGVIRDPRIHDTVIESTRAFAEAMGFRVADIIPSPLLGPAGNREFLMHLTAYAPAHPGSPPGDA